MFTLGIIGLVAVLVVLLILRRIARRRSPTLLLVAALPVLAAGAAEGRWPAALGLAVVVLGAVALLRSTPVAAR